MSIKTCTHCHTSKAIRLFSVDRMRKDGRQPWCKACQKEWRDAYRATPKGLAACRTGQAKYDASEKGRTTRQRNHIARMRKTRYRLTRHARRAVSHAVEKGLLHHPSELPCADCGVSADDYHHINGYETEHWFEIEPLCKSCHRERHSDIWPITPTTEALAKQLES